MYIYGHSTSRGRLTIVPNMSFEHPKHVARTPRTCCSNTRTPRTSCSSKCGSAPKATRYFLLAEYWGMRVPRDVTLRKKL